jgi:Glycosyl transferase family 8
MTDSTIRVFCGADRSQHLAFRVLEHSIRRHASLPLQIRTIDNTLAPEVDDPRYAPYTEFSFGRFAIPELCAHQGRAIYLDSDMLVFRDIAPLWNLPFGDAKLLIEIGGLARRDKGKQAAVMLLDCTRLHWDVAQIVAGLGRDYSYNELMSLSPLLSDGEMAEAIASGWNDLDHYDAAQTSLIHYTQIRTQPWVYAGHPHADVWFAEVALMLTEGALTVADLEQEVRLGFLRPSALLELGLIDGHPLANVEVLRKHDRECGYVAQARLLERFRLRKRAMAECRRDERIAKRPWLKPFYELSFRLRTR